MAKVLLVALILILGLNAGRRIFHLVCIKYSTLEIKEECVAIVYKLVLAQRSLNV